MDASRSIIIAKIPEEGQAQLGRVINLRDADS